jgi:hypothetical protein
MFRRKPQHLLTFKLAPGVAMNLLCVGKGNAYIGKGMLLRTSVSSWGRCPFCRSFRQGQHGWSAHLFHDLAAMDVDRCLASSNSNFSHYLFVDPTGNNQKQDLLFARCEGCKTLTQNGNFCLLRPPRHVSFQR